MGHRLLAVNVLAGVARIDDDALMPMVRHGRDDAVDILATQQFVVAARREEVRITRDLLGQRVPPIVQIGGGDAFDTRQADRVVKQPRTLHADADHAETDALSRWGCVAGIPCLRFRRPGLGGGEGGHR